MLYLLFPFGSASPSFSNFPHSRLSISLCSILKKKKKIETQKADKMRLTQSNWNFSSITLSAWWTPILLRLPPRKLSLSVGFRSGKIKDLPFNFLWAFVRVGCKLLLYSKMQILVSLHHNIGCAVVFHMRHNNEPFFEYLFEGDP